MFADLSNGAAASINAVAWLVVGTGVGGWFARQPVERLNATGWFTRLRPWESDGDLYVRLFAVRKWKRLVPEAGTWLGGMSKRRLPGTRHADLHRFAAESLRAERTHLTLLAVTPVFVLWNGPGWFAANCAFSLVINVPPIVVTRFNRHRLARLT